MADDEASVTPLWDGLMAEQLYKSPIAQLEDWLQQAIAAGVSEPGVMILATCDGDGRPDQRAVLLKHCDCEGLVFFANYGSKKAQDIEANPMVCAHFYWSGMDRQVRVGGVAKKLSAAETTQILIGQPDQRVLRDPAIQRSSVSSRKFLMQQYNTMKARFYDSGREPSRWGGYRIVPDHFEFWQGGGPRMRDRFQYRLGENQEWIVQRLKS